MVNSVARLASEVTPPKEAYLDGKWVAWENANVHVSTHALHYGTGVFAGIRAYWNEDDKQAYIFRLDDHVERLFNSCQYFFMKLKETPKEVRNVVIESVRRNKFQRDVYIRPLAFKHLNPGIIGVNPTGTSDALLVFAVGFGDYLPTDKGLHVCCSSFQQLSDNALPRRGKISGAYANSALASSEAKFNGFDDAIMLTRDGWVSEGTAMNLFLVRDEKVITPSLNSSLLEGITRRTILALCQDLGIPTEERLVQRSELYICDEAFYCGTGVQVAPIRMIDHRELREPKLQITKRIQKAYFDIVRGKNKKYKDWLTPVY